MSSGSGCSYILLFRTGGGRRVGNEGGEGGGRKGGRCALERFF